MRIHIREDSTIDSKKVDRVISNIETIFSKEAGIEIEHEEETRYFESYEWEDYYNDETGMSRTLLKAEADGVKKSLGLRYDVLLFLVDKRNWVPSEDGIWGWNLSKFYSGFQITQARFDNDHIVNSQGTIFHELFHTFDQTIYSMLGVRLEDILKVEDFDDCVVHGGCEEYEYIRHKENIEVLREIAPYLKKAYRLREKIYNLERSANVADNFRAIPSKFSAGFRKMKYGITEEPIKTTEDVAKGFGQKVDELNQ